MMKHFLLIHETLYTLTEDELKRGNDTILMDVSQVIFKPNQVLMCFGLKELVVIDIIRGMEHNILLPTNYVELYTADNNYYLLLSDDKFYSLTRPHIYTYKYELSLAPQPIPDNLSLVKKGMIHPNTVSKYEGVMAIDGKLYYHGIRMTYPGYWLLDMNLTPISVEGDGVKFLSRRSNQDKTIKYVVESIFHSC